MSKVMANILSAIDAQPGISSGGLVKVLGMTQGNVSSRLSEAAAKKYVERTKVPDPNAARGFHFQYYPARSTKAIKYRQRIGVGTSNGAADTAIPNGGFPFLNRSVNEATKAASAGIFSMPEVIVRFDLDGQLIEMSMIEARALRDALNSIVD